MKVLITNDDGVNAPGLAALVKSLSRRFQVAVVAPEVEQSAVGHAITLADPIKVRALNGSHPLASLGQGWAVRGTPADCVKLAVSQLLDGEKPDLVVSGINRGANAGLNLLYSGTVSAATEAAFQGLTGLAFSLNSFDSQADYGPGADLALTLTELVLERALEPGLVINVNFPARPGLALSDCVVARQGLAMFKETFIERRDPRGNLYYWQTGEEVAIPNGRKGEVPTDQEVLARGGVPVTPIHFDLTDHQALGDLDRKLLR